VPYGIEGWVGGAYVYIGHPERCVEWCRAQLARGRDTHTLTRAALVIALKIAGSEDEAMAATKGLIDAAEVTRNPHVLSFTLVAYGTAFRDADPDRAREAMRRGVVIKTAATAPTRPTSLPIWPDLKPNMVTRWPRSITSLWRSATTTTQAVPPRSVPSWLTSPPFSTGSGTTKSPRS
jgi:hypothetical protein